MSDQLDLTEPTNTREGVARARRVVPDCKHRQLVRVGANSFQCSRCGLVYTATLSPFNQEQDSAVDYAVIHAAPPRVDEP
jgi:ribosomal protein L37AE/L43A